jgi:hypothetical protein
MPRPHPYPAIVLPAVRILAYAAPMHSRREALSVEKPGLAAGHAMHNYKHTCGKPRSLLPGYMLLSSCYPVVVS